MFDKLHDALQRVSDDYLLEVENYKKKRAIPWAAAVAALLAVAILVGALLNRGAKRPVLQGTQPQEVTGPVQFQNPADLQLANLLAAPSYPQMVQKPDMDQFGGDYSAYSAAKKLWWEDQKQHYDQPAGYADSLADFFARSIPTFLREDENVVYSPVNVYMALAMLAETTGGNSRAQLLKLLGHDSMEQLRTQAGHVWNAHYAADGETTLLLGNSLWLDQAYSFRPNTVNTLANSYHASVFHGDLGTQAMNRQLQSWLDAHTGGLLRQEAERVEMDPQTVFALASTVYFAAGWAQKFSQAENTQEAFHCADHDRITTFMNRSFDGTYYWGEDFGAVRLELSGGNCMWLILPEEGVSLEEVVAGGEYLEMTMDPNWGSQRQIKIHLSLPKFDVRSQIDLIQGMQELGVTDVFDPACADFSPMTDTAGVCASAMNHAGRVVIDEEGVIAAAFTVFLFGGGMPQELKEINFTLDRPFLFIVSSQDRLPLFAGTVVAP